MQTTKVGRQGETAVCQWLEQRGYTIVAQNYCIRGGEIDIIAENGEYLAFVEVKTRRRDASASGFAAVTRTKRQHLIQAAASWCTKNPTQLQPRFDVACVTLQNGVPRGVEYYENAFDATGTHFIF